MSSLVPFFVNRRVAGPIVAHIDVEDFDLLAMGPWHLEPRSHNKLPDGSPVPCHFEVARRQYVGSRMTGTKPKWAGIIRLVRLVASRIWPDAEEYHLEYADGNPLNLSRSNIVKDRPRCQNLKPRSRSLPSVPSPRPVGPDGETTSPTPASPSP